MDRVTNQGIYLCAPEHPQFSLIPKDHQSHTIRPIFESVCIIIYNLEYTRAHSGRADLYPVQKAWKLRQICV